jgi:hypothetical protein
MSERYERRPWQVFYKVRLFRTLLQKVTDKQQEKTIAIALWAAIDGNQLSGSKMNITKG